MARRPSFSDSDDQQVIEVVPNKQKPVIKLKEWLHNFKSNNTQNLKKHIMSFFLSEGLYDVAKSFSQQAGVEMPNVDENNIKERYEIKNLIRNGDVEQALNRISKFDPQFAKGEKNVDLLFSLKCLKVINLIKLGDIDGSILVAQQELLPFTLKGEKYIKETEKVMGLLGFMNIKDSPNKHLVQQQHSSKIACKVNKHLLTVSNIVSSASVGKMVRKEIKQIYKLSNFNVRLRNEYFQRTSLTKGVMSLLLDKALSDKNQNLTFKFVSFLFLTQFQFLQIKKSGTQVNT